VIGMEKVPFERVLGAEIGSYTQCLFETAGVKFFLEQKSIKEYVGSNGAVSGVVLATGETLPADLVVIGAGVIPATGFVTDLERQRDGSLITDEQMRVKGAANLWAAGDLARFPYFATGELIRVEHYGAAMYQGAVAAESFLGRARSHHAPPFFWTLLLGKSVRYAGHATSYEEVVIDGELASGVWAAFYLRGDQVLAVAAMGRDPYASQAAELINAGRMVSATEVRAKKGRVDLAALLTTKS
jgi:NADPH-dependent 2,4-dienoyl-CoA reductase/sulfur reductase-like enzyme